MNLDPTYLMASLFVSGVGYVLFSYGRKQRRFPQLTVGLLMLVYPYFVSNVSVMLAVMVALIGLVWGMTKLGL